MSETPTRGSQADVRRRVQRRDPHVPRSVAERAPVYVLLPTGAKANQVFVIGTLTETEIWARPTSTGRVGSWIRRQGLLVRRRVATEGGRNASGDRPFRKHRGVSAGSGIEDARDRVRPDRRLMAGLRVLRDGRDEPPRNG